jgi:hypothetical protein
MVGCGAKAAACGRPRDEGNAYAVFLEHLENLTHVALKATVTVQGVH